MVQIFTFQSFKAIKNTAPAGKIRSERFFKDLHIGIAYVVAADYGREMILLEGLRSRKSMKVNDWLTNNRTDITQAVVKNRGQENSGGEETDSGDVDLIG